MNKDQITAIKAFADNIPVEWKAKHDTEWTVYIPHEHNYIIGIPNEDIEWQIAPNAEVLIEYFKYTDGKTEQPSDFELFKAGYEAGMKHVSLVEQGYKSFISIFN